MTDSPFEKHLGQYEEWFEKNEGAYQSELFAVKQHLPHEGLGVEIGVGSGRFAVPLGIKIGIDPSFKMAELARKRGVEVFQAVAENMPFADSSFDFALMVTTVCFVDDISGAFGEARRILKLSGRLIIGFVDKDSRLGRLYQERKNGSVFYKSARFYSVSEIISYLRKTGFSNFKFGQTIFEDLKNIRDIATAREGYGEGSFVVINAQKER